MFCAGLLLSIADLLDFETADDPTPARDRRGSGSHPTACPREPLLAAGTAGYPARSGRAHSCKNSSYFRHTQLTVRYGDPVRFSTANFHTPARPVDSLPAKVQTGDHSAHHPALHVV